MFRAFLASTSALTLLLCAMPARAQFIIDNEIVTIPGDRPDPWPLGNSLTIGNVGDGTLTIQAGGRVSNTSGFIGSSSGSTGTVTVSGPGSTWTNEALAVGGSGTGTLTIEDGGAVSSSIGRIGNEAGSTGTALITGTGSIWSNTIALFVGDSGSGGLTIEAGGTLTNQTGVIGNDAGSTGTVLVGGVGSTWTNSAELLIGNRGSGTLMIELGGTVANQVGVIGNDRGSSGTATVTGAGSVWTNSNALLVGGFGNGALTIADGGVVSNTEGLIGTEAGSSGMATVTGAGSTWTNSIDLRVSNFGGGTLIVEDGGAVANSSGVIGNGAGSTGSAIVTGANSLWTNSVDLFVGRSGVGTLTIADGGAVSNSIGRIGNGAGSAGTAQVTGAGSTWTNSFVLAIGDAGSGTLSVDAGGAVSNSDGVIGTFSGSTGAALVTGVGSVWTNSTTLTVGNAGTGELTIADGGTVTGTTGVIGTFSGSTGAALVTGVGSTWANSASLTVGNAGSSGLTIEAGGAVSNTSGAIGLDSGSSGTATVTGAGSTWANSASLTIGNAGSGGLTIEAGGAVSNTSGAIGLNSGSSGTVTVTGAGSTWANSSILSVGNAGSGTLTIEAGGSASNILGVIGSSSGSTGTVIVTGAESAWNNSANLIVGGAGTGELTIADGSAVSVAGGIATMTLAQNAGSVGTFNIGAAAGKAPAAAGTLAASSIVFGAGTGMIVFNHTGSPDGTPYDFGPAISGTGTLHHRAGTTILSGNSSGFGGGINVAGGALLVTGELGGIVDVADGGMLGGTGVLGGDVSVADGGRITPGMSAGTLTIGGDLVLSGGSVLDYELGPAGTVGSGVNDLIVVGGDLTLDGTLNISDFGGFGAGVYRLIDYGGALTDNGLAIGATPAGVGADNLFVQTSVAEQINLISTAGAVLSFWDGGDAALHDNAAIDGGSGSWRVDGRNWTGADGATNGPFQPIPTFAIFQGAAGVVTVDNGAGDLAVTGMQFATDGYVITGDPVALEGAGGESIIRLGDGTASSAGVTATIASDLTGTGALIKTDSGALILGGTNSYTGGTTLRGGILEASSDASLGATPGSLTLAGGAFRYGAGFASDRAVALSVGNGLFDTNGFVASLGGPITGDGNLVKAGAGTLTLTGTNSYTGNTLVQAGTLVGNASSIRGSIGNAGLVVFDEAGVVGFGGDIGGLGDMDGEMIKRGAGVLTLGGISTLAWTVEAGTLVSDAARFAGDLAIGSAGSFTFDQETSGSYGGTITGSGGLNVIGDGGMLLTGDSSGFSGLGAVSGTLVINGTFGGTLAVLDGGVLGGIGTIGTTTVAAGGTITPGNSIGTLTVDGDLTFAAGSVYGVEVEPGGTQSDRMDVTGTAFLDGGAVALRMTGTFDPTATYTILTAGGGITGTFDDISSDFAFLDPTLGYDANDVTLTLTRNDLGFDEVGVTRNQIATAAGLDSPAFGNPIYDAVVQLDAATARFAFDQLSGEIHASAKTALIEDARQIRDAIGDRLRAAFDGVGASVAPVMAYGPAGPELAPAATDRFALWSRAFGSWGRVNGDGNAARLDRSTGGFIISGDALIADAWRVGLLAGYSRSSFDLDDRASSGEANNYHLGLYGGTEWDALAFRSGLAYTWHDIETRRAVGFTGFSDTLSADYDAGTFQALGELGYRIDTAITSFEAFANLAHLSLRTDGFAETGGAGALDVASRTTDTSFTTLGVRAEAGIVLGDMQATARGMFGWRHAFGDAPPLSGHAFAGGEEFTIAGAPIDRNAAVLEAGLDLNLNGAATLGVSYDGGFGSGAREHGFSTRLGVSF